MKRFNVGLSGAVLVAGVAVAGNASATVGPPYPDTENCSVDNSYCLHMYNSGVSGTAIEGVSSFGYGLSGFSANSAGVRGDGGLYGVYGGADGISSYGVYGRSTGSQGTAVYGESTSWDGIYGTTGGAGRSGVWGNNTHNSAGSAGVFGTMTPAGIGVAVWGRNNSTATGAWAGYFEGKLKVTGQAVCPSCSGGLWSSTESDARLKTEVIPLADGLDRVMRLRAVSFRWKDPDAHGGEAGLQRGFIAQEVEKVLPEWVSVNEKGMKTVNYNGIDALLVDSVHSLKSENDALRDRVMALEGKRPVSAAGFLSGNGLLGLGLMVLGAAIIVSRRRDQRAAPAGSASDRTATAS